MTTYLTLVSKTHRLPEDWLDRIRLVSAKNAMRETFQLEEETLRQFLRLRRRLLDEGIDMLKCSLEKRSSQQTADTLAYTLACRGKEGDFGEVKRLGAIVAANPSCDRGGMMLDALGITALREGDDASAVRYFSAALVVPRRTHSNVHSMLNLGLSLANTGRRAEALKVLQKLMGVSNEKVRRRAAEAIRCLSAGECARFGWE